MNDRLPNAEAAGRAVAYAALYGTLCVGALSVAVGVTAAAWSNLGLHAAVAVGGAFAFAYPATILYAVSVQSKTNELR